jgi:hypothetical protein
MASAELPLSWKGAAARPELKNIGIRKKPGVRSVVGDRRRLRAGPNVGRVRVSPGCPGCDKRRVLSAASRRDQRGQRERSEYIFDQLEQKFV